MFAESSGAAIALSVLQRPSVKRESPPLCALALSSPWLDLTCGGTQIEVGSSMEMNGRHDPVPRPPRAARPRPVPPPSPPDSAFPTRVQVLKRPQLVRAAAQLLGAAGDASAPAASPLLAPPAAFRSLPPTLVHVGTTEILLDDALEFVNKCKSADVAATAKEFDGVLHGWHTFFPLMPVADAAVKEVADFLGPRLRREPVDDFAVAAARVVAPPPPAAPAAAWTAAPPVAAPEDITQAEAVLTELDVRPTAADLAAAGGARPARPASAGGARPARPSSACRRAGA